MSDLDALLLELCPRTLESTAFEGLGRREEGKVRDSYIQGDRRTIVLSDRVSCFDVVVGTIPLKGQVLNQTAAFWFEKTQSVARNHLLSVPDPNVSIVEECRPLPVEFVVRGYLTGSTSTSIWTAYDGGKRIYCGHALPDGMRRHEALPNALLTPTTKAPAGEHDELTSRDEILAQGALDEDLFDRCDALVMKLFALGSEWAAKKGLILVDTKYELGLDGKGELVVIDEIHTPDSSRYWYRDAYERAMGEGKDPKALDKEYVRRWLGEQGYKGHGSPPPLSDEVRCEAARRYIAAFEQLTGRAFAPEVSPPKQRIRENLGLA
jgi:phosphoribosylaminoimidazole-succinocarboxamide synthase